MYRIITTEGTELGITDSVLFIKRSPTGAFVAATREDAIGISYEGTPYNLLGHADIENAPTVILTKTSIDKVLREQRANMDYLAMMSGIDFEVPEESETTPEEVDE